jgi:hypothetical protein
MGFIFALGLTWFVLAGVFGLLTKKETRQSFWLELKARPFYGAFVWTWVTCLLTFFWGVILSAAAHSHHSSGHWEVWQIAGVGSLIGFIAFWFVKDPFR